MVGTAAAVGLLALAVWFAGRGMDWAVLRQARPGDLAMLAGLVGVNLLATAGVFWLITLSFHARPRVGYGVMLELIAASSLLNYIPGIRPGLWGRAAYLKARHGLPVGQSVVILGCVLGLAVVGAGAAMGLLVTPRDGAAEAAPPWGWVVFLGGVVVLSFVTPRVAATVLRRRVVMGWLWLPLRVVDLLAAAGRLWLAFRIVGQPIGFDAAVLAGAAALLVRLAGVTPNGLGLSEWVVAGLTGVLEPVSAATGAAAALVDRAVEVAVVVVAGMVGVARVRGRLGERAGEGDGEAR